MINFPKISIVTPSFNQGRFIEKTILSVLEQSYPNVEYIIIDGGSTDESVEIIKKYEKHLAYWVSEPDRGQSHAINKGFERATGEIFGWLNSDDWYHPGALKAVAEAFAANLEAGAVVGAGEMVDEEGNVLFGAYPSRVNLESLSNWFDEFFWQPSCFFKRDVWKKCGPLDENIHYAMDLDLWIKIAKKYSFSLLDTSLSCNLKHCKAKTTEFNHVSSVDAFMVILNSVGETEARKLLENFIIALNKRVDNSESLSLQKDSEIVMLHNKLAELGSVYEKTNEKLQQIHSSWILRCLTKLLPLKNKF